MRIFHAILGSIVTVLFVTTAIACWCGVLYAELIVILITLVFWWVATWRNITDARKDDLLDKAEECDEQDDDSSPGSANRQKPVNAAPEPTDQIQTSPPKRNKSESTDIRRL